MTEQESSARMPARLPQRELANELANEPMSRCGELITFQIISDVVAKKFNSRSEHEPSHHPKANNCCHGNTSRTQLPYVFPVRPFAL